MDEARLSQAEADALLPMEKIFVYGDVIVFPAPGRKQIRQLQSRDGREKFILDLWRGRIGSLNITMQNRARKTVVLARLDLAGPTHRNPDNSKVATPHLHLYRKGERAAWAFPVPKDLISQLANPYKTLANFMTYCNIVEPPPIQYELSE